MSNTNRWLIIIAFLVLAAVSWAVVLGTQTMTDEEKQEALIEEAQEFYDEGIYVRALPLLEEAVTFDTDRTVEAENMLKTVYINMMGQDRIRTRYLALLDKQMSRDNAPAEVFIEAAGFYLGESRLVNAIDVLRNGVENNGSEELDEMYEKYRYAYRINSGSYDDVTEIHGTSVGVCIDRYWGIAASDGTIRIPCMYDKVSTYSYDRAVVQIDGLVYAIDSLNNRLTPFSAAEAVTDIGNLASDRIPVKVGDKWYRATGELNLGEMEFEWVGTHFNGYAAAKQDGKWGVISTSSSWLIPAQYEEIIMDELGRCYAQGAVFVQDGSAVYLIVDGERVGEEYEEARPFSNEGYAAVRKNGQWRFIDISGNYMFNPDIVFEDALSFGQHLAAVQIGGLWGYINLKGNVVIEPVFLQAKSFSNGSAPVLTERGWQFITLLER